MSTTPSPADRWRRWQRAQGHAERTIIERSRVLAMLETLTGLPCHDAQEDDLVAFLCACRDRNLSKSTVASYYSHLKAFHRWLRMTGVRVDDPFAHIAAPRFPRRHPRPVSDEQLMRLLATRMHRRTRAMILLAACQGLRVHEIAKLRGEDLDVNDGTLRVIGKGGVDALLPLHPEIAQLAAAMPRRGYWFVSHTGNRIGTPSVLAKSVSDMVSNAMDRANIPGGAHRLRHWYATTLVREEVNLRIVQELLRHASLQTTQIYTQVTFEQQRRALTRVNVPGDIECDERAAA